MNAHMYVDTRTDMCHAMHRTGGKGRGKETGNLEARRAQKEERKRVREGDCADEQNEENISSTKRMRLDEGHENGNGAHGGFSSNGGQAQEQAPAMVISEFALRAMQKQGYDEKEGIGK